MVASVAFGGSEQPGVVTRYSTLFSEFQLKLTSNENGTPWNELPLPIVPKGFYESTARDGKFLAQVVVPGDLFDLKSSYLTALDQAIEDRHYLRDARNAADEYGRELSRTWVRQSPDHEEIYKLVSVGLTCGLGTLGAHIDPHHSVMGSLLGALVGLSAEPLGKAAVDAYHMHFKQQVPLAIKLIEPLENQTPQLNPLSSPLPPARWSAFMPVDMERAFSHCESLPSL